MSPALGPAAIAAVGFAVALLLEEASAGFTRGAVGTLRDDPDDAHALELAGDARAARLLSQVFLAVGAMGAGLFFTALVPALAGPVAVIAGVMLAAAGAVVFAPHGRGPLQSAGQAVYRPLAGAGSASRALMRGVRRLRGLRTPHGVVERVMEMDRVLAWLSGERYEDETDRVVATLHEFGEALAEDVMVPREEVIGIEADATAAEARALVAAEGFSRYPVYHESMDNVVGVLHVFDLLEASDGMAVSGLARPPLLTSGTKGAGRLLRELQVSYNQMAIVADELGGTAGIVTVEDLLEELVGEIHDETDEEEPMVRALEPGVFWVDAGIGVEDLNAMLDLDLEEGEYDTLAGLVLERLERIPRTGERLREDGVWLEVAAAEAHRIQAFRLTLIAGEDGDKGGNR